MSAPPADAKAVGGVKITGQLYDIANQQDTWPQYNHRPKMESIMLGQFMALLRDFVPAFATALGGSLDGLNAMSTTAYSSGGAS
ncbi:hypothetical protein [Rhodococcus sp. ACT016]|uniref:hypothetical protein n=1 Tax=Rhodococcus sp. ACT016 TaxID=3134808 RepID=UPI003D2CB563